MRCFGEHVLASFVQRPNRFLAEVQLLQSQKIVSAHVPDPGRLKELLIPSTQVVLIKNDNPNRKTRFTLVGVKSGSTWVNIDSQLSNRLFKEEFLHLPRYKKFSLIRSEFKYKSSRFDFLMENRHFSVPKKTLVEVKSATLVKGHIAMFPDAPTVRGARHVKELIEAVSEGYDAEIIFISKRSDAMRFTPHKEMDSNFYTVLKRAKKAGVGIVAVACNYDPIGKKELTILHEIPVIGI